MGILPGKNNDSSKVKIFLNFKFIILIIIYFQEYVNSIGEKEHFKDSQFLVFVNRILAFTISGLYLIIRKQPRHITPLYKYSYCSLSNILSSWCQYEALKFVSFPTQVKKKIFF